MVLLCPALPDTGIVSSELRSQSGGVRVFFWPAASVAPPKTNTLEIAEKHQVFSLSFLRHELAAACLTILAGKD